MANQVNHDGPNPGAFMVLVDLHSSMLGNQSDGELRATSTVVRSAPPVSSAGTTCKIVGRGERFSNGLAKPGNPCWMS